MIFQCVLKLVDSSIFLTLLLILHIWNTSNSHVLFHTDLNSMQGTIWGTSNINLLYCRDLVAALCGHSLPDWYELRNTHPFLLPVAINQRIMGDPGNTCHRIYPSLMALLTFKRQTNLFTLFFITKCVTTF